ncbi:MAG TPA: xanthine dehydrogenase family protein subunit M [Bryobacteraceae bacterium]|nr:xanthine dehydrogenase family protein subunit M [Bryobacteraceae bacterium]
MIPQAFEYTCPAELDVALEMSDAGSKPLAGGMSLIPMMKLRLATPDSLVDISRLKELRFIGEEGEFVRVGATTTHHEVEASAILKRSCPLLPKTAVHIGDLQVRNVGTIGGSVAHADPAADYPAALMALEATVIVRSLRGERGIPINDFMIDSFTTALEPGEIITSILLPVDGPNTGTSYVKMAQAASGYALTGVAVRVRRSGNALSMVRVGITGVGPIAYRARTVEEALEGTSGSEADIVRAAGLAAEGVEVMTDLNAAADYRAHLAKVQTARALRQALSELI